MRKLAADLALHLGLLEGDLGWARVSPVALFVAELAKIIPQHCRNDLPLEPRIPCLFVFLVAGEDLLNLQDALLQLLVRVGLNEHVQLVVHIPVHLLCVGASLAPHRDLAAGLSLEVLLRSASGPQDDTDVVGVRGVQGVCEVNLLRLLERFVVVRRDEVFVDLHALLDQATLDPEIVVLSPDFARVDTLSVLVIDGFRRGRAQICVV